MRLLSWLLCLCVYSGTGVTTYSLHPGAIMTELVRHVPYIDTWIMQYLLLPIIQPFFKTIPHGAQTQICCAVDEELTQQTGRYYRWDTMRYFTWDTIGEIKRDTSIVIFSRWDKPIRNDKSCYYQALNSSPSTKDYEWCSSKGVSKIPQ